MNERMLIWYVVLIAWLDRASKNRVFSWVWHAIVGLPGAYVIARWPQHGIGVVFFYREFEQVSFRFKNNVPRDWLDHVMDVLAPWLAGWLLFLGVT